MAEKKTDWKQVLIEQGLGFLGDGVKHVFDNVVTQLNEFIDETQKRIETFLVKLTKATILFTIFVLGAVFILVGGSQYLSAVLETPGVGYALVGLFLVMIGFVVKSLK